MIPNVAVLLSSYNGEKYIEKQILTILNQKQVNVKIYIRDDGSNDNTVNVIKKLKDKYTNIELFEKGNIGFELSFNWLIRNCKKSDYYAFSDQDDLWKENKLSNAINLIKKESMPCLYCSNLDIVYNNIKDSFLLYDNEIDYELLFNHYYYLFNGFGCTMVWNDKLHSEMIKVKNDQKITQDTLANIVAGITGKIIYDKKSYIYHIIHENNAAGLRPDKFIKKVKKYMKRYLIEGKDLQKKQICTLIYEQYKTSDNLVCNIMSYDRNLMNRFKLMKKIHKLNDIPKNEKSKFLLLILFGKF